MKILMISHQLPTTNQPGTMAPVARQIESLRRLGLDIQVLELKGSRKVKYIPALWKIAAMVNRVDIVHAHFGYCGWIARSQFTKPVIVSFMGDDLLGTRNKSGKIKPLSKVPAYINKKIAGFVDGVIVKTPEMAQAIAPVKAHVVPNGVDIELFRPMPIAKARQKLNWDNDSHYVLFPGNPALPVKCFPLAQAGIEHASRILDAPINLIPLQGIKPEDVPIYMNACSAMVMVSHSEGSPNVVKEAMACNLPITSVPVGDTVEQLKSVDGYALVERDPQQIGAAIATIIRGKVVAKGRDAILKRGLDLTSVAYRIKTIYHETLNKNVD
jgi:glycosyltransferase involved in cell wall biosynthesis